MFYEDIGALYKTDQLMAAVDEFWEYPPGGMIPPSYS